MNAGAFSRLLELLGHPSQKVYRPALSTIAARLFQDRSQIQRVVRNKIFPILISHMSSAVKDIQTKAGWILGHVLDGTDEEVGTVVAQGSVRALRDILVLGNSSAALVPLRVLGKVSLLSFEEK